MNGRLLFPLAFIFLFLYFAGGAPAQAQNRFTISATVSGSVVTVTPSLTAPRQNPPKNYLHYFRGRHNSGRKFQRLNPHNQGLWQPTPAAIKNSKPSPNSPTAVD